MPSVEQLDDQTAVRIVGFDGVNPLDRITTTKREQWIAAPRPPYNPPALHCNGLAHGKRPSVCTLKHFIADLGMEGWTTGCRAKTASAAARVLLT
jgi:hypothetical protein